MKEAMNASEFYQQKITTLQNQLTVLYKKRSGIAWLRFAIFVAVCLAVYFLWSVGLMAILVAIVCGIALFLIIVSKDIDNKTTIKNLETLLVINKDETNYLDQNFADKYDGKDMEPANHVYAKDLDVFGKSSLFQYINRCSSQQAIKLFAERLLKPLTKEQILQQQSAVKELATKQEWWQQYEAFGLNERITNDSEKRINEWLKQESKAYTNPAWKLFLYIYPLITLSALYFYLDDVLPAPIFGALILIFFLIGLAISSKIQQVYVLLSRLEPVVATLYKQLNWFEQEKFESDFLLQLQNDLANTSDQKASTSIKELQQILNRFDVRLNVFAFFILNTFFLWDLWQMIALNNWKKTNKLSVTNWYQTIALVEVAGSLSTLHFNNADWSFPKIAGEHFVIEGKEIGHPLINKQQAVTNNFSLQGIAKIDLITGSNMAGKSTFLRSLGVNTILAYAGSAVFAKDFTVSIANIMSSMRIEDNLAENTSTFYAELKKLKSIIDAVNQDKKLFILLDEILRGTNSLDRHAGSKALIQQLIKKNAVAIIATHDIELSKLESEFPASVTNYNFDVQVNGDQLYFDYKLKEGVCKSMNASVLMKQIGIEM